MISLQFTFEKGSDLEHFSFFMHLCMYLFWINWLIILVTLAAVAIASPVLSRDNMQCSDNPVRISTFILVSYFALALFMVNIKMCVYPFNTFNKN